MRHDGGRIQKSEDTLRNAHALTLEQLLVSTSGFGLDTASPLQRAICRVSDGLPLEELWNEAAVREAFGGARPEEKPPDEFVILAGIRTAKSMIAAAKGICASQNCDVSGLKAGEIPRIPLVATSKDNARVVFNHLIGQVLENEHLRQIMVSDPTSDAIILRHPTGRPIEVKVVALSKAGATLVSRWLAGCVFDEAPRMVSAEEGVLNLDDARKAIIGRMLPGAQIMYIGSPHAPFGPVYDLVQKYEGKPGSTVVVRGKARAMNPVLWTEKKLEKLRLADPTAYKTDALAEFSDPQEAIFSSIEIDNNTREAPVEAPPVEGCHYVAAMDPATRRNAWGLVVLENSGFTDGWSAYRVMLARQWKGTPFNPLKPRLVLREIAELVLPYRVDTILTDQYSFDALADVAEQEGLSLLSIEITAANRLEMIDDVRLYLSDQRLELPPLRELRSDLLRVKKRVTSAGYTIHLPRTSDGRHCDFVPPLCLSVMNPPALPDEIEPEVDPDLQRAIDEVDAAKTGNFYEKAALSISRPV